MKVAAALLSDANPASIGHLTVRRHHQACLNRLNGTAGLPARELEVERPRRNLDQATTHGGTAQAERGELRMDIAELDPAPRPRASECKPVDRLPKLRLITRVREGEAGRQAVEIETQVGGPFEQRRRTPAVDSRNAVCLGRTANPSCQGERPLLCRCRIRVNQQTTEMQTCQEKTTTGNSRWRYTKKPTPIITGSTTTCQHYSHILLTPVAMIIQRTKPRAKFANQGWPRYSS